MYRTKGLKVKNKVGNNERLADQNGIKALNQSRNALPERRCFSESAADASAERLPTGTSGMTGEC